MKNKILKRLAVFAIRTKLGLKVGEWFRFTNQKSDDIYFFTKIGLKKLVNGTQKLAVSDVSLRWLLDDGCTIVKYY